MPEPVAAFNFDAVVGGVVPDLTGNGHDFALPVSCTLEAGLDDHAIRHSSAAADSGGPAIFGQTAHRTLMIDIVRTSNSDAWVAEMKNMSEGTGVWGFLFSGSSVQARAKDPSNSATFASAVVPASGTRYQLAMTYDGTNIRLFFNGVQQAITAFAGPIWTSADAFQLFDVASTETMIDNMRVYDVALSAAELAALVGVPVAAPAPATGGRLKYESAPGVWTPVPLKTETGDPLAVKTETSPGTWEATS
jgi:hypothetical protein